MNFFIYSYVTQDIAALGTFAVIRAEAPRVNPLYPSSLSRDLAELIIFEYFTLPCSFPEAASLCYLISSYKYFGAMV